MPSIIELWLSASDRIEAVRQEIGDGRDRREIGNPARGEDQRAFLAVQVGELGLEFNNGVVGAGNVAGAAGADADFCRGVAHRRDHVRMAAHAEIIVRAPDGDVAGGGAPAPFGLGEGIGVAREIGEDAVAALGLQRADRGLEIAPVVHRLSSHQAESPPPPMPAANRLIMVLIPGSERFAAPAGRLH